MKQKPSLQFYQQDFLGSMDVQTMTAEQVGCYCLLLFNCYNNGGTLPSEPEELSMLCRGIAPASKVLNKFYKRGEYLRHKRIDEELEKQVKFSKKQSENAQSGWQKRKTETMPPQSHGKKVAPVRQCSSSSSSSSNNIRYIVRLLNTNAGKKFKPSTDKTVSCIKARLSEGYTLEDFEKVIAIKTKQWRGDEKMEMFLRPETLFGSKFESYLNEKSVQKRHPNWDKMLSSRDK